MGLREPFEPTRGIPDFMWTLVDEWIREAMSMAGTFNQGVTPQELGLKLRVPVHDTYDPEFEFLEVLRGNDELTLTTIDLLLFLGAPSDGIRTLLDGVDHEFTVDVDGRRLISRVNPATQHAYQEVTGPADHASALLASAWAKTLSRDADPSGAWMDATKAVEELLKPIVSPKDSMATISKMAKALRDGPSKWRCSLRGKNDEASVLALAQALDLVGYAPNRHGGTGSVEVDPLTSRTVVLQAITICDWLRSGVLRRAED